MGGVFFTHTQQQAQKETVVGFCGRAAAAFVGPFFHSLDTYGDGRMDGWKNKTQL